MAEYRVDPTYVAGRVQMARTRNLERDRNYRKLLAIRRGDYETVAPGLFNTAEFDKPLVANLIDTTARDIAEVMAPLPTFNCQSAALSNKADQDRQDLRAGIANAYVQNSRLQDQMFSGADRYGSFGYMAYIVEPDFDEQMPVIRISDNHSAYYTMDWRGRVREFFEPYHIRPQDLVTQFPDCEDALKAKYGSAMLTDQMVEVVRWHDAKCDALVLLECNLVLHEVPNKVGKCLVRVVERPTIDGAGPRGQFDDVIWVQIARALVQMYTMNAIERSVNAPLILPKDVNEIELGPFAAIQTDNPQGVGTVPLQISPGLFPESQILAQEQRTGSRYPEGRSGSIDASIITGQGVQALMGTFDTQVQTFQRLNASALEDVIALCFEMDEKFWGDVKKTCRIKDNGAPREFDYVPNKDIKQNHVVDVTYGAIAGLDPNRGLVFLLQALAGGLIAKSTARRHLPVDLNVVAEERQIQLEQVDDAIAMSLAQMPLAIPQMAMSGQDPTALLLQIIEARKLLLAGKDPAEAMGKAFAPKEDPNAAPAEDPLAALMAGMGGGAPAAPGMGGGGGAQDLMMSLAGMTAGGQPNLQSTVSRMRPVA